MDQRIIDAAVEVFGLGPEHQDELLRFGMKLQDMEDQERQQESVDRQAIKAMAEEWYRLECTGNSIECIVNDAVDFYIEHSASNPPATRLSEEEINSIAYKLSGERHGDFYDGAVKAFAYIRDHFTAPKEVRGLSVEQAKGDLQWAMTWMRNEASHLRERGTPQPALEIAIEVVVERHGLELESLNTDSHGK